MKSTVLTTNLLCPGISSKITRIDNKKVAGHSGSFTPNFVLKTTVAMATVALTVRPVHVIWLDIVSGCR